MKAMKNPLNESETLSGLQNEDQCGKYFLKAPKEATVHKAKSLHYSIIDGQMIKRDLKSLRFLPSPSDL